MIFIFHLKLYDNYQYKFGKCRLLTEWIRLAAKPHVSAACAITGSIFPLILMHLYPLPLNGFSGNQWSRYLRRRTSTTAALNFSSCCSLTAGFRLPNLNDKSNFSLNCYNFLQTYLNWWVKTIGLPNLLKLTLLDGPKNWRPIEVQVS